MTCTPKKPYVAQARRDMVLAAVNHLAPLATTRRVYEHLQGQPHAPDNPAACRRILLSLEGQGLVRWSQNAPPGDPGDWQPRHNQHVPAAPAPAAAATPATRTLDAALIAVLVDWPDQYSAPLREQVCKRLGQQYHTGAQVKYALKRLLAEGKVAARKDGQWWRWSVAQKTTPVAQDFAEFRDALKVEIVRLCQLRDGLSRAQASIDRLEAANYNAAAAASGAAARAQGAEEAAQAAMAKAEAAIKQVGSVQTGLDAVSVRVRNDVDDLKARVGVVAAGALEAKDEAKAAQEGLLRVLDEIGDLRADLGGRATWEAHNALGRRVHALEASDKAAAGRVRTAEATAQGNLEAAERRLRGLVEDQGTRLAAEATARGSLERHTLRQHNDAARLARWGLLVVGAAGLHASVALHAAVAVAAAAWLGWL